jgi:hypothetical protein
MVNLSWQQEGTMKYLMMTYGDEKEWNALAKDEQDALLAQDEVLRKREDLSGSPNDGGNLARLGGR